MKTPSYGFPSAITRPARIAMDPLGLSLLISPSLMARGRWIENRRSSLLAVQSLAGISHLVSTLKLLGYIDPSTGSLVFQAIAASILSGALFVRGARDRIVWLITGGWRVKPQSKSTALLDARNDSNPNVLDEISRNAA
jgi:hypothetical protein